MAVGKRELMPEVAQGQYKPVRARLRAAGANAVGPDGGR